MLREFNTSKEIITKWERLKRALADLQVHLELVRETGEIGEIPEITAGLGEVCASINNLEISAKLCGPHDKANAILSLHAGAGGTEACDWAEMLLRMYHRWADSKGFKTEIIDILPGEEAGIKRVTTLISGSHAYGFLQSESGVHRLVRISPFDSNARRHTSFVACDVIPEIENLVDIKIEEKDLRIDTYRASGHGGQHVNKTDSAVRITHLPTGVVVACQTERSQFKNKYAAMKILLSRLYELEEEKKRQAQERHYDEKGDIAWGHQIRSYVFMPYQLVKDLRTDYETGQVEAVLNGELDLFIDSYLTWKLSTK